MSFRRSLSWIGIAQGVSFVLHFASSVVFARYLNPYQMGIFAVATALVGLLSIIQQISLPALIVREENITEDFTRTAFTVNAALCVLLALAIVGASFLGAAALQDPGVGNVLLMLAITPLFGIVSFLPMAHMEREARFKELALITTASAIVNAVVGIGLVVAGFSYMSIAYAQVVGNGVFALLGAYAGRRHARCRFGLRSWQRILDFSLQMLAISGLHGIGQRLSELLVGRLLGLSALGLYNRASGMNTMLWYNINSVVGRVVLVDYADALRQGLALRDRYVRTVAVMTATIWPAFAGLAVIAKPFVIYVYGQKWAPAVGPFAFLALTSILLSSITMTWELFTATGRLRDQTRVETTRVLVGIALFAMGCMISLEAAAASRALEAAFAIWLYRPHLNQMTGTSGRDFRKIYLESSLLTLLAIAPAAVLMLVEPTGLPSVPLLAGAILLGVVFWVAGLALLKHALLQELRLALSFVTRRFQPVQARNP